MLRIIGGEYRHRHLEVPESEECRPTMDKVREAVFSSLGEKIINARFLDLFAGSGAVGLEAYSRGAKSVVFNEKDTVVMRTLVKNIASLDPERRVCLTLKKNWTDAMVQLSARGMSFDVVYLDPPYALDINAEAIQRMRELGLIGPGSVVVAEQTTPLKELEGFTRKAKKYGKKHVGIYVLGGAAE